MGLALHVQCFTGPIDYKFMYLCDLLNGPVVICMVENMLNLSMASTKMLVFEGKFAIFGKKMCHSVHKHIKLWEI